MHYFLFLIVTVLLSACVSKEEKALMNIYNKENIYHQQLQKTEKIQFKVEGITQLSATATHLKDKKSKAFDEIFVLGIYAEVETEASFESLGLSTTLNGSKPKSIKALAEDSPYLKHLSFVSSWSQFYLLRFSHTEKKSLKLSLTSTQYGEEHFYFAKVAKYVLSNESF